MELYLHPAHLSVKLPIYFLAFALYGIIVAQRRILPALALSMVGAVIRYMAGIATVVCLLALIAISGLPPAATYWALLPARSLLWWSLCGAIFDPPSKKTLIFSVVMTVVNIILDVLIFGPTALKSFAFRW